MAILNLIFKINLLGTCQHNLYINIICNWDDDRVKSRVLVLRLLPPANNLDPEHGQLDPVDDKAF